MFPLAPNEVALRSGPYKLDAYRAIGNGSYTHSSVFAFGSTAFVVGSLIGNAIGNTASRSRAAADATVTWRPDSAGGIVITNLGFYLMPGTNLLRWNWSSIDMMEVASFNVIVMQGRSTNGPVTWRITSHWAEMIFLLWALNRHPQHPQLFNHQWIPTGWPEWAATQGYPSPLHQREIEP